MSSEITVVIPTIPPRDQILKRAVESVHAQFHLQTRLIVRLDEERRGAAATRHAGLMNVQTEWVAFLDDDDFFYPEHLSALMRTAQEQEADYVFSWFNTCGTDPFPSNEHRPWTPEAPHQTTITTLVRTELAKEVGFLNATDQPTPDGNKAGEDWAFTLRCIEKGAKFTQAPGRTWHWCHHRCHDYGTHNTSGEPSRW